MAGLALRHCFPWLVFFACGGPPAESAIITTQARAPHELHGPETFAVIGDRTERSRALFIEATRVMLSPRCTNCHPVSDSPAQGDFAQLHDPPVARGPDDRGVVGLACASCHQDRNLELARVPGAPDWHLAPKEMAWVGHTASQLCEQIKDPKRNGNKTLAQIAEHAGHDKVVAWGWAPGHDRVPAPGSQATFGALIEAWVRDGAFCPNAEEARR